MKVKELIATLESYRKNHNGDDHYVMITSYDYHDGIDYVQVGSDANGGYIELIGESLNSKKEND